MSEVKQEKLGNLVKNINWKLAIKASIYAIILMVGTLIGALLHYKNVQGFTIFMITIILNTIMTIFVFKSLKKDLSPLMPVKKKKSPGNESYTTESDK